jgi:acetyltransferase-like isoleucine patch superfamily enzyme
VAIHSTAIISPLAKIDPTVTVGPYCVIGNAQLDEGCVVHSHVIISDGSRIGARVELFPGALVGKEPKGAGALARKPRYEQMVIIGDDCSIGPHSIIYYDVLIGSNTLIGDGASVREQCRIGSRCVISRYVTINYNATIGNRTKIMDGSHITGNSIIGDDVFISLLVGSTNDNLVREGYGDHVKGPTVGDRVVVGVGALLLPGVVIGSDATIAAGSVVTKDVEAATLVAGSPARLVRRLDPK